MRVERATVDDVDVVTAQWIALAREQREYGSHLEAGANRDPIRATIAAYVADDGVFVARDDDEIVGFVMVDVERGPLAQDVTRGIVQNVFVRPGHRDDGVGAALLDAAETALHERGADVIALEALAGNVDAHRFYRRRGYAPHRIEFERVPESDTHSRDAG